MLPIVVMVCVGDGIVVLNLVIPMEIVDGVGIVVMVVVLPSVVMMVVLTHPVMVLVVVMMIVMVDVVVPVRVLVIVLVHPNHQTNVTKPTGMMTAGTQFMERVVVMMDFVDPVPNRVVKILTVMYMRVNVVWMGLVRTATIAAEQSYVRLVKNVFALGMEKKEFMIVTG
tara:strand:- start:193 stop:699 length:507 start_codon:yes stop_codon:yes gene_type:complete